MKKTCQTVVTALFAFIFLFAFTSCALFDEPIRFEYDELSQDLDRIELVEITTETGLDGENMEVIKVLDVDMRETVLREIASMEFHTVFGSPQPLKGTGIVLYEDEYRLILTSSVICKESLDPSDDPDREMAPGEFYYEISTGGAFEKLLEEIS